MQQSLAFKWLVAIIGNDNRRRQALSIQRDAVKQTKAVRPLLGGIGINGAGREAKVEFHAGAGALAGRLAEEVPARVSSKAMLRERFRSIVIGGNAKDLEHRAASQ